VSNNQWGTPSGHHPPQRPPSWHPNPSQYGVPQGPPGPNQQLPHGIGWGQYGGAPGPGGPRQPKRNRGPLVALGVVAVLLIGIVLIGAVVSAVLKSGSGVSAPTPTYSPSAEPTYSDTQATPSLPPTVATRAPVAPTTRPVTTRPTAPRPTQTTTKPKPSLSPLQVASRSRIYFTGRQASVGCRESQARPSNQAGAEAYYARLKFCLDRAWARQVRAAGFQFRQPRVVTWAGYVDSPCGSSTGREPPFYCGANETIYMNLSEDIGNYNRYPERYNKVWARMWTTHQFAHEYGHHIQALTGILRADVAMQYDAPTRSAALEINRRKELQASCFSDVFIGANRSSYPVRGESLEQWQWLIWHVSDYGDDHGDAVNHKYWALRGWNGRSPGLCNTYVAVSSLVR
jgi:hypothetical protein